MEIISYVQDRPQNKRINLPVFNRRAKHNSKSITYSLYSSELKSFSVQKIKPQFSVRELFVVLGQGITVVQKYFVACRKIILLSLVALIFGTAAIFGAFRYASYKDSFTGPLEFQSETAIDIENLNKLMANFALEGSITIDESGNIIDENQPIKLTNVQYAEPVKYQNYKVRSGDTISGIAKKFGLKNVSTLISVNDIGNVRQLAAGQKLKIPSIDGIVYTVKKGDTLDSVVKANKIKFDELVDVNDLSAETLTVGQQLFLPGVSLDSKTLKTAMGDKFIMPIQAPFRWTSPYGKRVDPIAKVESFHTGTDMACPTGTPIVASMSGKVITSGVSRVYGNYVIIDHGNNYQTLYAHMSKIIAQKGQWVSQGTRIGLVGSTGYSTGPHLHFTVYKNGKMINPMSVLK